jgi:archaellum component FlaD/FlaE
MSPDERTPEQIRADIDKTRGELGDTVESLAEKTDVKAQAKAKVEDVKEQTQAKVEDAKEQAQAKIQEAKDAAPESPQEAVQQAQAIAQQVQAKAKQDPKPFVIGGVVLVLFLLWRRRRS